MLIGACFSLALAQSFPNFGARDIRPPTTGDGATGDSYGARLGICNGELLVAATGDQVPSSTSASGRPDGSVYRYKITTDGLTPNGKLSLPGVEQSALFGLSLACDENELFIGAPGVGTIDFASDAGTVFRYLRQGENWQFNGEVPGARPQGGARFGYSMALNSAVLLVGAPGESAAYLYRRTAVSLSAPQRIQPPAIEVDAEFGFDVAVKTGEIAVSAPKPLDAVVWRYSLATPAVEISRVNGARSLGSSLCYVGNQLWIGSPAVSNGLGEVSILDLGTNTIVQTISAPQLGGAIELFGDEISSFGQIVAVAASGARAGTTDGEGAVHIYALAANQTWVRTTTVRPVFAAGPRADAFGYGLIIGAEGVFVGAPYADAGGHPSQGKVFRFSVSGTMLGSIDSGRGAAFDRFGQALSVSGNRSIVGAFLVDSPAGVETGEAYIYERTRGGWRLEATLVAPDVIEEQRFGVAVDIDGDWAVVGSYWDVVGSTVDAGSAYVFRKANGQWQFWQKLIAPMPRTRAYFGFAVAIDGDRIVVGARGDAPDALDQGSVVFFQRDASEFFRNAQTLRPRDSTVFDSFGAFVDLRGDLALIGAPGVQREDSAAGGRAYLMRVAPDSNSWTFLQTLEDPQGLSGDGFGFSIALAESPLRAYVGTPFVGTQTMSGIGRVVEFRPVRDAWSVVKTTESPIQAAGVQFATSLASHPDGVVVGAVGIDSGSLTDVGGGFFVPHSGTPVALVAPPNARGLVGRTAAVNASGLALLGAPGTATVNPQEGAVFEYLADALFGDGLE